MQGWQYFFDMKIMRAEELLGKFFNFWERLSSINYNYCDLQDLILLSAINLLIINVAFRHSFRQY